MSIVCGYFSGWSVNLERIDGQYRKNIVLPSPHNIKPPIQINNWLDNSQTHNISSSTNIRHIRDFIPSSFFYVLFFVCSLLPLCSIQYIFVAFFFFVGFVYLHIFKIDIIKATNGSTFATYFLYFWRASLFINLF